MFCFRILTQHFADSSLEKELHCFWDLKSLGPLKIEEGKLLHYVLFEPRKRVRGKTAV